MSMVVALHLSLVVTYLPLSSAMYVIPQMVGRQPALATALRVTIRVIIEEIRVVMGVTEAL